MRRGEERRGQGARARARHATALPPSAACNQPCPPSLPPSLALLDFPPAKCACWSWMWNGQVRSGQGWGERERADLPKTCSNTSSTVDACQLLLGNISIYTDAESTRQFPILDGYLGLSVCLSVCPGWALWKITNRRGPRSAHAR